MIRRRRKGRHAGASTRIPRLKMTSMMDILTVLLLFLLKSFVVDGGVMAPPPGVELPGSTSVDTPEAALVVAVTDDAILVGERTVTTVTAALAGDGLLIPELEAGLLAELAAMDRLAERRQQTADVRPVTIQGDRDLEFRLLQRVMYTCDAAGFDEMALAVVREAGGSS